MKTKTILALLVLLAVVFLAGCNQAPTYQGYSPSGQQPQGQGGQYVGGGCGVAPQGDYAKTPIESLTPNGASL
ncbi:MAG TPA: hypothetical protein VI564_04665 [Candidatus Nanoarchaeia archaeon]|nr:hypothetical protein [Candidatus Nanoarchaeia archaeon]